MAVENPHDDGGKTVAFAAGHQDGRTVTLAVDRQESRTVGEISRVNEESKISAMGGGEDVAAHWSVLSDGHQASQQLARQHSKDDKEKERYDEIETGTETEEEADLPLFELDNLENLQLVLPEGSCKYC